MSWGDDDAPRPATPDAGPDLAAELLTAIDPRCHRTDLYESRNVARGAIRRRRRERGLLRHLFWWPWQCRRIGCDFWHIGPRGNRAI